jgi:hypothetical protein
MHIVKAQSDALTTSKKGAPPREVASSGSDQLVEGNQPVRKEESTDSLFASECPTRKVLNPLLAHLNQPNASSAELPKTSGVPLMSPGMRKGPLLVAIAIAATAATAGAIWQVMRSPKVPPLSLQGTATNRSTAPPINPDPLRATPALNQSPPSPPQPKKIRVEISVQPAVATLQLDNRVTGGNQLRFDTPKDEQAHTVHASATGFVPFTKTVSFSTDVYLSIELQRVPEPKPDTGKGRGLRAEIRPRLNSKLRPESGLTDDLGMSRPSPRRPSSTLDERDPYEP